MAHDVFISYSSRDRQAADTLCAGLERRGIVCWMAPRDVRPGADWSEEILSGIEGSGAMVLVFSENANQSNQIKREVERAVNKGLAVLPVRIENVMPANALEYFISTSHWLDAMEPPLEPHCERLAEAVRALLGPRLLSQRRRGRKSEGDAASAAAQLLREHMTQVGDPKRAAPTAPAPSLQASSSSTPKVTSTPAPSPPAGVAIRPGTAETLRVAPSPAAAARPEVAAGAHSAAPAPARSVETTAIGRRLAAVRRGGERLTRSGTPLPLLAGLLGAFLILALVSALRHRAAQAPTAPPANLNPSAAAGAGGSTTASPQIGGASPAAPLLARPRYRCRRGFEFDVSPDDAEVRVGGRRIGTAEDWSERGYMLSAPGRYNVRLSKEDRRTMAFDVEIAPDAKYNVCIIKVELADL